MWKIGNVKINNRVVFAPMAGISNISFRHIIKEMGAALVYSEMVSSMGIIYNSKKTIDLLKINGEERPISLQIFGSDVDSFVKSAIYIEKNFKPDIIDINMGCPVPKVALRSQAGSSLLKNPEKIYEIVSSVVKSVKTPVTVKIRSGWDDKSINAVDVSKVIEKAGAAAICIHGRTRAQGYSGNADWNIIKQVKAAVSIPVIGNGDIKNAQDAKRMLDTTECDAVMIGRATLGNPWIIKQCLEYLKSGKIIDSPTNEERIDMIKHHYELLESEIGQKRAILEIRSHALWYLKGIPSGKIIKQQIVNIQSKEELYHLLKKIDIKEN